MPFCDDHPCDSTATFWFVQDGESSEMPFRDVRIPEEMHERKTQGQGDCLYLCFIGLLQSERYQARNAHLERLRSFAQDHTDLPETAVESCIANFMDATQFDVLNPPTDVPIDEVSVLRTIFAAFFQTYFPYYWSNEEPSLEVNRKPGPLKRYNVGKKDFRQLIREEVRDVVRGYAGFVDSNGLTDARLDDPEYLREAYARKIMRRYPNDAPIVDRNPLPDAPDNFPFDRGRELQYSGPLEIHIASNLFGVNAVIFQEFKDPQNPKFFWEEETFMFAYITPRSLADCRCPEQRDLKSVQWTLIQRNSHYDFLETKKTQGWQNEPPQPPHPPPPKPPKPPRSNFPPFPSEQDELEQALRASLEPMGLPKGAPLPSPDLTHEELLEYIREQKRKALAAEPEEYEQASEFVTFQLSMQGVADAPTDEAIAEVILHCREQARVHWGGYGGTNVEWATLYNVALQLYYFQRRLPNPLPSGEALLKEIARLVDEDLQMSNPKDTAKALQAELDQLS